MCRVELAAPIRFITQTVGFYPATPVKRRTFLRTNSPPRRIHTIARKNPTRRPACCKPTKEGQSPFRHRFALRVGFAKKTAGPPFLPIIKAMSTSTSTDKPKTKFAAVKQAATYYSVSAMQTVLEFAVFAILQALGLVTGIANGIAKINVATEFQHTFLKSAGTSLAALDGKFVPVDKFMEPVIDDCAAYIARLIRFFAGR